MGTLVTQMEAMADACGRMDRGNAARALGKSYHTLTHWAKHGIGPKPFKVGGRCYYWAEEVLAYGRGESAAA